MVTTGALGTWEENAEAMNVWCARFLGVLGHAGGGARQGTWKGTDRGEELVSALPTRAGNLQGRRTGAVVDLWWTDWVRKDQKLRGHSVVAGPEGTETSPRESGAEGRFCMDVIRVDHPERSFLPERGVALPGVLPQAQTTCPLLSIGPCHYHPPLRHGI